MLKYSYYDDENCSNLVGIITKDTSENEMQELLKNCNELKYNENEKAIKTRI